MTTNTTTTWYRLRGVEYSTDLEYFMQHQLLLVTYKDSYSRHYSSRLESFKFAVFEQSATPKEIYNEGKLIHEGLLAGMYGKGEFTN